MPKLHSKYTNKFLDHKVHEFSTFKRDLKKRMKSLTKEQQSLIFAQVDSVLVKHGSQITRLFSNSTAKKSILDSLSTLQEDALITSRSATKLSPSGVFPRLAALALTLGSAAAISASDYQTNSGAPAGGIDFCTGILFGCLQGYLTNGTKPWDVSMPQFFRVINEVATTSSSQSPSTSVYLQLRDCITLEKMADIIKAALATTPPPSGPLQIATTSSGIYKGYQTSFETTNVPGSAASGIQSADLALSLNCQNPYIAFEQSAGGLAGGGIAGIVVGVFVVLVIACAAGYCFKDSILESTRSRTTRRDVGDPSTAASGLDALPSASMV